MANRVFPANSLNLDGIPLTSTGVRPVQSPKLILNNRAPTPADANKSYPMGTIWVVLNRAAASPDNYEFWYLADNQSIPGALWLRFAVSPSGEFAAIFPTDNGTAFPIGTVLNIFGSNGGAPNHTGDNINTFVGSTTNTVVVALNHSLHMPRTSADGTQGVYYTGSTGSPLSGGNTFLQNYGVNNTFLGESSGNLTLTTGSAQNNTAIGALSQISLTTGNLNSSLGSGSLSVVSSGGSNLAAGAGSLFDLTTGSFNTCGGVNSGHSITTFNNATAFGYNALGSLVNVSGLADPNFGPVAIGYNALGSATLFSQDDQASMAIGQNALASCTEASLGTTAIGLQAMQSFVGTTRNVDAINTAVGHAAMNQYVTGGFNTALGARAMQRTVPAASTGSYNTAVGCTAMGNFNYTGSLTGSNNTSLGFASGGNITTGSDTVIAGYNCATTVSSGNQFVAIGSGCLQNATNPVWGVAIGYQAMFNVGTQGGDPTIPATTGSNVGIGYQSLYTHPLMSGANVAVGFNTLNLCTGNGTTTGAYNTAIGHRNLQSIGVSVGNTALGAGIGQKLLTGNYNTMIGNLSASDVASVGGQYTGAESNNILIQNTGVTGESNVTRIGAGTGTGTGQQNACFISGIRGITTTAADAIAVLISSTGQLGTVSSSIRFKENVRNMNDDSSFIYDLRPVTFNYKDRTVAERSPGLIAEEVETVAPWLVARDMDGEIESVRYHELSVLLLNELKKLNHRVALLEDQLNDCSC